MSETSEPPAAADAAKAGNVTGVPPTDLDPLPGFEAEEPFKLFERPRPPGAVHAAVQDELLARWNVGGTGDPAFVSNRNNYHPGARVVVDTTVVAGRLPARAPNDHRGNRRRGLLSQHGLLAQSRRQGYWPFRLCFEEGLRRQQTIEGQTVIRFVISARGTVPSAHLVGTELEDSAVAQCLTQQTRKLRYAPPGRRVKVKLSIKLWPGDAPVPLAGPPMDEPPQNPGALDSVAVTQALQVTHVGLKSCYRQGLARDAALWGRVQFAIDQDAGGRVTEVREDESRFPDRSVVGCMIDRLREVSLPKPAGGPLSFAYALRLGRMP